jgi:ABC-type uncharacterized transport system substrate-binding protein
MKANKILRAVLALLITAGVLLLLDLGNRKSVVKTTDLKKIAIFKMASRVSTDDVEKGVIESLAQQGFIDGKSCTIKRFCAEGDMATANTIAQNIVSSKYDIAITISTPALQVMANANKRGEIMHVFCGVTDPYASGVGITGSAPSQHPKHLVGIGTFQPVEKAFDIAKQMNPNLKKVGTVWCVSETCSEACVKLARKKCKEMGIELVEASVESSTQVLETAMSLTSRGVEALWLGGDNVVESGIDQLINAANKAQIPLFTNNPYDIRGNTLFGVGAEYNKVGQVAGDMAADILKGKSTSEIGVGNVVPIKLKINPDGVKNLNGKWDAESVNL